MAVSGARVTVTTTATKLSVPDRDSGPGTSVAVINLGAATVDLGDADVTTGNGFPLAANASLSLDLSPREDIYAIAASGTVAVAVLRTGT